MSLQKFDRIYLNNTSKTRYTYTYAGDTTGFTVTFRVKKNIDDVTPIANVVAVKLTETATSSTGYVDVDTIGEEKGCYYCQFKIADENTPPIYTEIVKCEIDPTLF